VKAFFGTRQQTTGRVRTFLIVAALAFLVVFVIPFVVFGIGSGEGADLGDEPISTLPER
jgi:hypothetical protein